MNKQTETIPSTKSTLKQNLGEFNILLNDLPLSTSSPLGGSMQSLNGNVNIQNVVLQHLICENDQRTADHVSSGKLSASDLGSPVQWQVLRYLGVPKRPTDDYELGKFRRGRDCEDFVLEALKEQGIVLEQQVPCAYRDCIGYLDAFINKEEIIEVKSCVNMAFKHIAKEERAKYSHILQSCYYALALGKPNFSVVYVSADDYRIMRFDYRTKNYLDKVNIAIDTFQHAVQDRRIPKFVALEAWQSNDTYNRYSDWKDKSELELAKEAERLYALKGQS